MVNAVTSGEPTTTTVASSRSDKSLLSRSLVRKAVCDAEKSIVQEKVSQAETHEEASKKQQQHEKLTVKTARGRKSFFAATGDNNCAAVEENVIDVAIKQTEEDQNDGADQSHDEFTTPKGILDQLCDIYIYLFFILPFLSNVLHNSCKGLLVC